MKKLILMTVWLLVKFTGQFFSPAVKGIESSYKKGVLGRMKQHLHLNGDTVGWEPAGGKSPANKHGTCWRAYRGCVEDRRTDRRILQPLIVHHKTFDQVFLKPIEYWAVENIWIDSITRDWRTSEEVFWRRSQESHLISNHLEFIDYFSMRFLSVPPIMPPHVFPCQLTG